MCVAVPKVANPLPDVQQIELICSFDQCTSGNRLSYLVRFASNGNSLGQRLRVEDRHRALHPATSLLRDTSRNVLYWSIYDEWPFDKTSVHPSAWGASTTRRKVLVVDLSVDYNILSIRDVVSSSSSWIASPSRGRTLEAAAVNPRTGTIFAFVAVSSSAVQLQLLEPSLQDAAVIAIKQSPLPVRIQLPTVNFILPPRVLFSAQGRFFVQRPAEADTIRRLGDCVPCPNGRITLNQVGGLSITDCVCASSMEWLDRATMQCRPITTCKMGEFIRQWATPYSNYNCSACGRCLPGTYRNLQQHCDGTKDYNLDVANPEHCKPCGDCGSGSYYQNLSTCNGSTSSPPIPASSFCVRCRDCPDMHNIMEGSQCTGKGSSDTVQCIFCSQPCGMF
jgi:hypothetical protein